MPPRVVRVAVVGSGLAGLTTAYLLSKIRARTDVEFTVGDVEFEVHLFEKATSLGMDSHSVSVPLPGFSKEYRIDVPMRAFQGGYYPQLIALYKHLGVSFRPADFSYSFSYLPSLPSLKQTVSALSLSPTMIYNGASGRAGASIPTALRQTSFSLHPARLLAHLYFLASFGLSLLLLLYNFLHLQLLSAPLLRSKDISELSWEAGCNVVRPQVQHIKSTDMARACSTHSSAGVPYSEEEHVSMDKYNAKKASQARAKKWANGSIFVHSSSESLAAKIAQQDARAHAGRHMSRPRALSLSDLSHTLLSHEPQLPIRLSRPALSQVVDSLDGIRDWLNASDIMWLWTSDNIDNGALSQQHDIQVQVTAVLKDSTGSYVLVRALQSSYEDTVMCGVELSWDFESIIMMLVPQGEPWDGLLAIAGRMRDIIVAVKMWGLCIRSEVISWRDIGGKNVRDVLDQVQLAGNFVVEVRALLDSRVETEDCKRLDVERLRPRTMLNQAIINYFACKWCGLFSDSLVLHTEFMPLRLPTVPPPNPSLILKHLGLRVVAAKGIIPWKQILIPVHLHDQTHWITAVIDFERLRIKVYDSLPGVHELNKGLPLEEQAHWDIVAKLKFFHAGLFPTAKASVSPPLLVPCLYEMNAACGSPTMPPVEILGDLLQDVLRSLEYLRQSELAESVERAQHTLQLLHRLTSLVQGTGHVSVSSGAKAPARSPTPPGICSDPPSISSGANAPARSQTPPGVHSDSPFGSPMPLTPPPCTPLPASPTLSGHLSPFRLLDDSEPDSDGEPEIDTNELTLRMGGGSEEGEGGGGGEDRNGGNGDPNVQYYWHNGCRWGGVPIWVINNDLAFVEWAEDVWLELERGTRETGPAHGALLGNYKSASWENLLKQHQIRHKYPFWKRFMEADRNLPTVSYNTFLDWHSKGSKYAAMASGGSVYILVLIAGLTLQEKLHHIDKLSPSTMANLLHCPPPGTQDVGIIICSKIIPAILYLSQILPLNLTGLFLPEDLQPWNFPPSLDGFNLHYSDRFFEIIPFKYVFPDLDVPMDIDPSGPAIIIHTAYEQDHPVNLETSAEVDHNKNYTWTEMQRGLASEGLANAATSLEELSFQLESHYEDSVRRDSTSYLGFSTNIIPDNIRFKNSDKSLMAWVCTSLPSYIRDNLHSGLKACVREMMYARDSGADGEALKFGTYHFSWYNRHATKGTNAPTGVQPLYLSRDGTSRTNYSQFIPYTSADMKKHAATLEKMEVIFQELFGWVEAKLLDCLPWEYMELSYYSSELPGNSQSIVHPFVGFVININVTTKGHRDDKDNSHCLIIPIGQFTGGTLVLYEQGLVIEAKNGDLIVFNLKDTTHLNLHYSGERVSFVFHTDSAMAEWMCSRNGWKDNETLH
ncbi:hypothetical protein EWM64_g3489 [Hericium alpestre]|uniref:Ubiquitin-like protease family profile domain-containing protein n=1 Tax=Hericium alpestre TaxID=135208 RepID=A0A4Z0A2I6_9AGAM|nr:hypothetical protein EWM64_g3489 [Hericium alpestre]